jgi:type IV secretory pathway VirB10-like protein
VIERFTADFPDESGREQSPSAKEAHDIEAYESGRRVATTVLQLVVLSIVVIAVLVYALNARACRTPAAASPAQSAPVASTPAPGPPARPVEPPPTQQPATPAVEDPAVALAPAPPAPAGDTSVPAQTAAPIQLGIVAQSDCWLMVKVDKAVVYSQVLVAGERLTYQASASVTLVAGNAGGLRLTINGKSARPLGTSGEVVTTTITPDTIGSFLQ